MADNKSYYSDDAIKAKLSSLNDAQDVIVNVAQWLLFNRRNAARTADLWTQKLKDSQPQKRLSLIYLANEIVQQSKVRKKDEFVNAFSPHIVEATSVAYRSAPHDIQQKLKRVVEVWRSRYIFDQKVQAEIESKIQEIDRARATKSGRGIGGSLLDSSIPSQLRPTVDAYTTLSTAESKTLSSQSTFETSEKTLASTTDLSLPQQSAHLSTLLQCLAETQTSISTQLQSRNTLISALQSLLAQQKSSLANDEAHLTSLLSKKTSLDGQKRHVEDMIVRGISSNNSLDSFEPPRPDAEPLTPPPMEIEPEFESPKRTASAMISGGMPPVSPKLPPLTNRPLGSGLPGLGAPGNVGISEEPASKRRKVVSGGGDDYPFNSDALGQIDPEVAAMLAK